MQTASWVGRMRNANSLVQVFEFDHDRYATSASMIMVSKQVLQTIDSKMDSPDFVLH